METRTDKNGVTTAYTYDIHGRLKTEVVGGVTTGYTYDAEGNLLAVTEPLGTTTRSYDALGRVKTKTQPLGAGTTTTTFDYDIADGTISGGLGERSTTDGRMTYKLYDRAGRLVRTSETVGSASVTASYEYYPNGSLKSRQMPGNVTTAYTYYKDSRLHQLVSRKGTDVLEVYQYTYDAAGRLSTESDSQGTVKAYEYNTNGARESMVYAQNGATQQTVGYQYDTLNRLWKVKENGAEKAVYTYDANGNRLALSYPATGLAETYAYNLANLVTSVTNKKGDTVVSSYAYSYYLDGNQRTKTDHTGLITTYAYNGLGQLASESQTLNAALQYACAYEYDGHGNRASLTVTGPESYVTGYAYDLNNRLLRTTKTEGQREEVTRYFYDPNGNQIGKTTESFDPETDGSPLLSLSPLAGSELSRYNGLNQLVEVRSEGGVTEYAYRPDGLRASKTADGVTTSHVWDGANMVAELTGGTVTGTYLRGINLISATQGGATSYFLYNAHGDVVQLTNASGAVTKSYDYDAFGNEKTLDPDDQNPWRYCAEYLDLETNTYYLRARNYSPTTGRFLSEDTHWNVSNMIYGDNPVKWNEREEDSDDPLGLNTYTYLPNAAAIQQSGNLYVYGMNKAVYRKNNTPTKPPVMPVFYHFSALFASEY